MSNKLVTYDQFNPEQLKGSEPISQEIKKPNETIKYHDIKLSYNYGTEQDPIIQDLFFEGPIVTSTGIKTKEEPAQGKNGPYNKVSHAMMHVFDLADNDTRNDSLQALEKLDDVHIAAAAIIGNCKGKLKMHDFDPTRPGGVFKSPVYWHRDEVTGEKIKGKNPNIWVKIRGATYNRTLFTDLDGRPIDWNLLSNVNITMIPLYHFEKIYVGSKASMQIYLASAIILKIVPVGTESRQTSTMDRLKAKYGSLADQVEAQLADLRMARQETLQHSVPLPSSHTEFGSDYSSGGTMHTIPTSNSNENSNENNPSLQEFLGNAPTMNNQVTMPSQTLPQAPSQAMPQTTTQPIRLNVQPMKIN